MTAIETPARERLDISAASVLAVLPAIGKLMVGSSELGVTHERIGPVEKVTSDGPFVTISGEAHDSRIDTREIAEVFVDRSGRMRDKIYPRIEFRTSSGAALFSVVGFDGLEPFDAALATLGNGTAVEPEPAKPAGERGEVEADDPGSVPFDAAVISGEETVIGFRRNGFQQLWHGHIEAVKPAIGFINVMRPDFHLHLKAGTVASWREEDGELRAEAEDGSLTGLFVTTPDNLHQGQDI